MLATRTPRRLAALGATLMIAAVPAAAQATQKHAMKHNTMKHHHAMKHHPAMKHGAMKKS
jgi:hypothetical protein